MQVQTSVLQMIGWFVKRLGVWGPLGVEMPAQLCEWRAVATLKVDCGANFLRNSGSLGTGVQNGNVLSLHYWLAAAGVWWVQASGGQNGLQWHPHDRTQVSTCVERDSRLNNLQVAGLQTPL